jgi:prevent-host-death family protein
VRTITATEASRNFAALLDEVSRGETIVITRAGKRVASIAPTTSGNGAQVLGLLRSTPIDPEFAADVLAARHNVPWEGPAWPDD